MMKKLLIIAFTMFTAINAFCFDWPQAEVSKDSFNSYFGQNRGGTLSTSVIFSEPEEVKAAEDGFRPNSGDIHRPLHKARRLRLRFQR